MLNNPPISSTTMATTYLVIYAASYIGFSRLDSWDKNRRMENVILLSKSPSMSVEDVSSLRAIVDRTYDLTYTVRGAVGESLLFIAKSATAIAFIWTLLRSLKRADAKESNYSIAGRL